MLKTRIQFFNLETKKSKTITIKGLKFDKIVDNVKYFLKQLMIYPEIKLICYGGKTNGKKTINRRRKKIN